MDENVNIPRQAEDDANKDHVACCFCRCQANIQAVLRPGVWIPGLRSPHMYQEKWSLSTNPAVCIQEVVNAVRMLNSEDHGGKLYELAKINKDEDFIQVHVYSYGQWLYIVEIKFKLDEKTSCTEAKARSFSSGLLPVAIPLSFLWNCLLFPLPFCDLGKNKKHLNSIRQAMGLEVKVISKWRGC